MEHLSLDGFDDSPVATKEPSKLSLDGFGQTPIVDAVEEYQQTIADNDIYAQWDRKGKIGIVEYADKFQNLLEKVPFVGAAALYEPGEILYKFNKLKNNEYAPGEEAQRKKDQDEVYQYALKQEELRHRGLTGWAQFTGEMIPSSSSFMIELIASAGIYPLLKKGAKKGAEKILNKELRDVIGQSITKRMGRAVKPAGVLADVATRTVVGMPHRVALGYQDRRLNDHLAITNKGELLLRDSKESPALTWGKAFGDVMIENITEIVGGKLIGDAANAIGKRLPAEFVEKFISSVPEGKFTGFIGKSWSFLTQGEKRIAFHGILQEYGEERLGDLLRAYTGVDDRDISLFDKTVEALFPDKEQILMELGLFTVYGSVSFAGRKLDQRMERRGMGKEERLARLQAMSETEKDAAVSEMAELDAEIERLEEPGRVKTLFNKMYRRVFNRFAPIEDLSEEAKKLGIKLDKKADPKLMARSYLGIGPMIETTLVDSTFKLKADGNNEVTGEGLKPILDSIDETLAGVESKESVRRADFQDYLIARRVLEDLAPRGVEISEARITKSTRDIIRLEQKYGAKFAEFDKISARLFGYQSRVLDNLVESGQISKEEYDVILGTNKRYIPFERVIPEDMTQPEGDGKKGFTKAKSPLKEIEGSELEIEDVYESIIGNTIAIMESAQRNRVAKSVAALADVLPGKIKVYETIDFAKVEKLKGRIKKLKAKIKRVGGKKLNEELAVLQKDLKAAFDVKKSETLPEGLEDVQDEINKVEKEMSELEEKGEDFHNLNEQLLNLEAARATIWFEHELKLKAKENVIEYFEEGNAKYVEVASELYEAMSGMAEGPLKWWIKLLAFPAKLLRVGATITPDFIVSNYTRDQFTAVLQTQIGFRPFLDPVMGIADILGKKGMYLDWIRSGSAYSGLIETSRDGLKRAKAELLSHRTLLQKLNIITHLSDFSQLFEQATRVGMFRAAKRKGLSDIEAGFEAREGTLDFGKRGAETRDYNAVKAFFNAGIQAFEKTVSTFRKNPIATSIKGSAYITIPTILLYLKNRDDEEYWEIPQWQRDIFWNIKIEVDGEPKWFTIPKPFGLGQIFATIPERFLQYVDQEDPQAFEGLAANMANALIPTTQIDSVIPTAFVPVLEGATNYNFFTDRDIVPEYKTKREPFMQFNKWTSATAKEMGNLTNISPAMIDNAIRGYTGTAGKYVLEASDALINGVKRSAGEVIHERPDDISNFPFVRRFIRRRPYGYKSESVQRFFNLANKLETAHTTAADMKKVGDKRFKEYAKQHRYEIKMHKGFSKARRGITSFGKEIERIVNSDMDDDAKRIEIEAKEIRMTQEAKKLLDKYAEGAK